MQLRSALPEDTPFLRALHHRAYRQIVILQFGSWDERAQDDWFEKDLASADFQIVELAGAAVGVIGIREADDALHLVELQILPERQGQGLGSALLSLQLERARALQKPIQLRVLLQNRARSLHERFGFRIVDRDETHYSMLWRPDSAPLPPPT
jgi:ribosomal protein S18 acetylase RimI-like enzyme